MNRSPDMLAIFAALAFATPTLAQPDGGGPLLESAWRAFETGYFPTMSPIAMAHADLDGDVDIDVVVAQEFFSGPGLVVMLNGGGGAYTAGTRYDLPYLESIADVALADIDRDGRLDAIVAVPDANSQSSTGY